MWLFNNIDNWLIKSNEKNKEKPSAKFFRSNLGLGLSAFAAIYKCIEHGMHVEHKGHLYLAVVFYLVATLIFLANISHLVFKKNIDGFEFRIKAFEIILLIVFNILHILDMFDRGQSNSKILLYSIISTLFVIMLSLANRVYYLKYKGLIKK